ncbi:hypothetical protein KA005_48120, partial [bacterium]|nr:hypothetical protein [bacterium]
IKRKMKKRKRSWLKPKLVALVRGSMEEAVLEQCKHHQLFGPEYMDCDFPSGPPCQTPELS